MDMGELIHMKSDDLISIQEERAAPTRHFTRCNRQSNGFPSTTRL